MLDRGVAAHTVYKLTVNAAGGHITAAGEGKAPAHVPDGGVLPSAASLKIVVFNRHGQVVGSALSSDVQVEVANAGGQLETETGGGGQLPTDCVRPGVAARNRIFVGCVLCFVAAEVRDASHAGGSLNRERHLMIIDLGRKSNGETYTEAETGVVVGHVERQADVLVHVQTGETAYAFAAGMYLRAEFQ